MITNQLLKQILSQFDILRWMLRWSIDLGKFYIRYISRVAIKVQVLADLISELILSPEVEADKHTLLTWIIFIDGFATMERGSVGLVLKSSIQVQNPQ